MLLQDIRYAVRSLVAHRGVTIIVITCLALGIGVNATLFSVVDGVLLQPLPFADADRLVLLNETSDRRGVTRAAVSFQNLRDWQAAATSFSGFGALAGRSLALSDGADAERYEGALISWDLFATLGVNPALGRAFAPSDDRPGAEPVIILSDAVWRRRYNADPAVIGRSVQVNTRAHTIVGVMPQQFQFPENEKAWIPLAPTADGEARGVHSLFVVARLKPGVDIARARTEVASIAATLAAAYPATNQDWSATASFLSDDFIPDDVRLILWTMMGAVTLVLLIACANVANLMLARASVRQREFAVRAAIGASRARMVRQLLTECIILGLAAAPLGLAIAALGVVLMTRAVPVESVPYYIHWEINARAIVYTTLVSALTGIVFGLAPAVQAGRLDILEAIRDGSRGTGTSGRRARGRHALVVAEVALSLVLLIGAALFVRSSMNLEGASPGFETRPLLTLRFFMTGDGYREEQPRAQRVEDIVRRIEALPGIEAATASNFIPLDAGGGGGSVIVDGRSVPRGEEPGIAFIAVTPRFFKTLAVPILQGRDFTDAEGSSRTPVAVIDDTMARKLWPDDDPVGRRFRLVETEPPQWFTVIGVTPDLRRDDMFDDRSPVPAAYVPHPYAPTPNTGLIVRTAGDPAALTSAVRTAIRASDPALAIFNVRTMEDLRRLGFWQFRLFGVMFGVFGAIALLLAAIGVYGVLSFAVSQRTQEIGLRMALGAGRRDVRGMIVRQGVTLAGVGIALGLVGAFGVTRVIGTLLYNLTPTDPVSFIGVSLFLTGVAFAASYLPARRATAVDPIVALKNE